MAPQAFENCVKNGGRVRTKTLSGGRYQRICFKDGKSYAGEIKTKKSHQKEKTYQEATRKKSRT